MIQEIRETVAALQELGREEGPAIADLGRRFAEADPDVVIESGRGTSDHACIYGQYLIESLLGIPTALALGSLYTHYDAPPRMRRGAVITVSQSGETEDVCQVAKQSIKADALTIGITNARGSTLDRITGKNSIFLHAGPEKSVAATKTFTASLMAFLMLVHAVKGDMFDFEPIAGLLEGIVQREAEIRQQAERHTFTSDLVVVGTGYSYAIALEGALKLKETCYVNAQGLSSVDLIHGPLAVLNPDMPVIIFAPDDACLDLDISVLERIRSTRAHILVVSDSDRALQYGDFAFRIPKADPTVYPLMEALFVQLFAYSLSMARKLNPDQPRFLHKISWIEGSDRAQSAGS
jgi:glucosamine--fructose-6-phosphate aminotransferase (isomerizing)